MCVLIMLFMLSTHTAHACSSQLGNNCSNTNSYTTVTTK